MMRFSIRRFLVLLGLVIALLEGGIDARRIRPNTVKICRRPSDCNGQAISASAVDCLNANTCESTIFTARKGQIDCKAADSCRSASINGHSQVMRCYHESCRDLRVNQEVDLKCKKKACAQMTVQASQHSTVHCQEKDSCDSAKIVSNAFVTCEGTSSCKSLIVSNNPGQTILCKGDSSCEELSMETGGTNVHIECVDHNSCANAPGVCNEGYYGYNDANIGCKICPAGSNAITRHRGIGSAAARCRCDPTKGLVMENDVCVCPITHFGNTAGGCTKCTDTHNLCEAKSGNPLGTGSAKSRCACKLHWKIWEVARCYGSACRK